MTVNKQTNKQTEKIINLIKMNPTQTNKQIVDNYGLDCHPNNLSNIRRRFNLPRSPRSNNLQRTETDVFKSVKINGSVVNKGYTIDYALDYDINDYTKFRFIAELMGYRGTSLNLRGYKSWIRKQL